MERNGKATFFMTVMILATLFILFSGPLIAQTIIHILVQVFSLLLIIWAVITRQVAKAHKQHNLPSGYFFITEGPYEIVRHPIYVGYLLIMISFVEMEFTFLRILALLIILAMILLKIIREEHTLGQEVKTYQEYKAKTKALIPFLL
jgi:protein-S-isoprenylcysteine O-methyltransferase Ste14